AGGVLGLAVGMIGVKLLASLGAAELPLGARVALDARVAVAALVSALAAGLVLAGPVIWLNLRGQVTTALKSESRGGTVSRAVRRWGHGLIVAQITLAFVLLAGAGLLASSLRRVLAVSPGFHPEHVLTVQLGLTADRYRDEKTRLAFADRLLGAARALPGVNHAAVSTSPPFAGEPEKTIITAEGHTRAPGESIRAHYLSSVIGDVWQTLGIPLRAGRLLEDADNRGPARVCVVDEVFAQRYWPGQSALGRRVAKDPNFTPEEALTIVGVVGQIKHGDLADTSALGAVYRPYRYDVAETIHLLLRSSLPPSALSATLQKAIHGLDPELPVQNPRPLQEHIDASLVQRRAPALLASCYAAVALLLAAIGIYGVFAYVTSRRQREIGVRLALGALPGQIRNQFLATGARLLATGVVLGGAGAWLVGRAMRAMLFGVPPFHWATLAMTAAIMGAVSLAACAIPARRATKVSPASALNAE
ncbi:MAG TPA: FtsX-like permease family protein, partial [Verrucomicrobiae bacterium]|nr:FtsX-like permease family protein [Verrucomicrobiae bacterium]